MKRSILARGLAALALVFLPVLTRANDHPTWWALIINAQKPASDYAAANVGQLKAMAVGLFDHLEANFLGGAGEAATTLVKSWFELNPDGSFHLDQNGKRVPKTTGQNYGAVNLGQLKRVAKPFYDQLMSRYYARGYPWQANPDKDPDDFAMANLGQLKRVFNLDVMRNSDSDYLPDLYELANGMDHLTPNNDEDTDGDGSSDYNEFSANSDPLVPLNGQLVVTKVNDAQHVYEDSYLNQPIILRVTAAGKPIRNLPVIFTVSSGKFADWRTTPFTPRSTKFVQSTDSIGEAAAQYRAPLLLTGPVTITASLFYGGAQQNFTFSTVFTDADPGAPSAPAHFKHEIAGPSSLYFTWTDTSSNEDGFVLSYQTGDNEPWQEIIDLPPNTTSYLLEDPIVGANITYMIQSFKN